MHQEDTLTLNNNSQEQSCHTGQTLLKQGKDSGLGIVSQFM